MNVDKIFFVSFERGKPQIVHSKGGTEAVSVIVSEEDQDTIYLYCPFCHSDNVYFSKQAWERILKRLEKFHEGYCITIHKNFSIGREVLYSKEVAVLERKDF